MTHAAARRRPVRRRALLAIAALAALVLGSSAARSGLAPGDPPLPPAAIEPFAAAVAAAEAAAVSPRPWSPDAPAWRAALTAAREALEAAPEHPATLRLQLRVFGLVGWWVRAVEVADDLAAAVVRGSAGTDAGGAGTDAWADPEPAVPQGPPTSELVARSYAELAFSRYQAGAREDALAVYERWLTAFPDHPDALRWIGRLRLELGDPAAAVPVWSRLLEVLPGDAAAQYFLAAARLGAEVGAEASSAFLRGIEGYERGDLAAAAEGFSEAVERAPEFVDAWAWAGRVALEDARAADAARAYARAVELRPDDAGLAYFLRVAATQRDHGVTAGRAFFAGLAAYERGDVAAAAEAFEVAARNATAFVDAWAWLGRVRHEQGRFADAEAAWSRVVRLDPDDERARGFVALARAQQAYAGPGVADRVAAAFGAGVAAFERADLDEATRRFREVVAADAQATVAWAWLGRVAMAKRDFEAAAEAYGRGGSGGGMDVMGEGFSADRPAPWTRSLTRSNPRIGARRMERPLA